MKVECPRKELLEAVSLAATAASVRSALPILTTLRIEADPDGLSVLGCDGEMWAQRKIMAATTEPGGACVSAKLLSDIVSNLPDGMISLETEGTSLVLRQGANAEWKLMFLPADEFPVAPDVSGNAELTLTMAEFREAVDGVSYAVADDNSRPQLTGVLFTYNGNELTLVATDTHRLAVLKLVKEGIGSTMRAIVPEKALRAIKSLPVDASDTFTVRFDDTRLAVDAGSSQVISQLLAGAFPDWERVVPAESTRTWILDRAELLDHVKRTMILARDSAGRVKFSGQGEAILLSSRSEDKGEAKELVGVVSKNGEIDIAFNGRYVIDALSAMKADGIKAELTEPSRPAVFRPVDGGEDQFCVIMPMALS